MSRYSKLNIVYQLQKWMDSVAGQTFMNYAYSWGAAIVILGTLFKLTHLSGANLMLFIGMGTEVFVFFISAFDRPFDKTADGMDLATDSQLEAEAARLAEEETANTGVAGNVIIGGGTGNVAIAGTPSGGIIGGVINSGDANVEGVAATDIPVGSTETGGAVIIGGGSIVAGNVPPTPAPAVSADTAEAMEEATTTYVERLNELNEVLVNVAALSKRLSTDSEEMENLNRTLTGIARVYEMQLKSASQQIGTQDEINAQTRRMAEQITELNSIYTRMIEAMTVNMKMKVEA